MVAPSLMDVAKSAQGAASSTRQDFWSLETATRALAFHALSKLPFSQRAS
jgi:hypothetical protein